MNEEDFFLKIDQDVDSIIPIIKKFLATVEWKWVPYQNIAINVESIELEILEKCPLLSKFNQKFGGTLHLYNIPGQAVYTWHRDHSIGCALNMVLESYNCHTLFSKSKHPLDSSPANQNNILSVVELKYELNKFYIFNNQLPHSVTNLDRDRTLVTYVFPKPLSYYNIRDWYNSTL
jgi:hypothetical protein